MIVCVFVSPHALPGGDRRGHLSVGEVSEDFFGRNRCAFLMKYINGNTAAGTLKVQVGHLKGILFTSLYQKLRTYIPSGKLT